jgi:hypothetical protein
MAETIKDASDWPVIFGDFTRDFPPAGTKFGRARALLKCNLMKA